MITVCRVFFVRYGNLDLPNTARKLGKFTSEVLLIVAAEKGITKAAEALKESAKSGKLSKVGNTYAKAKEKSDSFVDDLVKGNSINLLRI